MGALIHSPTYIYVGPSTHVQEPLTYECLLMYLGTWQSIHTGTWGPICNNIFDTRVVDPPLYISMGPLHTWVFGDRTSYQEEPCYALGCLTWVAPSGRGGSRLPLGTRPGQILKILSSVSRLTSRPRCRTRSNQTLLKLSYI